MTSCPPPLKCWQVGEKHRTYKKFLHTVMQLSVVLKRCRILILANIYSTPWEERTLHFEIRVIWLNPTSKLKRSDFMLGLSQCLLIFFCPFFFWVRVRKWVTWIIYFMNLSSCSYMVTKIENCRLESCLRRMFTFFLFCFSRLQNVVLLF